MTVKYGTSDDWADGDVLFAADLLDSLEEAGYWLGVTGVLTMNSVCRHSATTYSYAESGGDLFQSTDTLVTSTSKNTTPTSAGLIRAADSDSTVAFFIETDVTTGQTAYTADSGATWTSKTSAVFATKIYDMHIFSTAMIVVAGHDTTNGIVYSTDQGGTWNNPSTPPSNVVYAVCMVSATVGYAIDSVKNIWKTTDGCDTWVDTTDNASVNGVSTTIFAIDTDTLIFGGNDGELDHYVNSTNTLTQKIYFNGDRCLGVTKTTSGNYYGAWADGTTNMNGIIIAKSSDGTNWNRITSIATLRSDNHSSDVTCKTSICEYGTDQLVVNTAGAQARILRLV